MYPVPSICARARGGLRRRLFSKLCELDVGYFVRRSKGDLLSRLNADVASVQTLASTPAVSILSNVGTVVGTMGVAFALDWQITLAAMVATPFYLIVSVKSRHVFRSLGLKSRSQAGLLMSFFEEALSSVRLTKGLAREQEQLRRYLLRIYIVHCAILERKPLTFVFRDTIVRMLYWVFPFPEGEMDGRG